jgi:hypothetical protein
VGDAVAVTIVTIVIVGVGMSAAAVAGSGDAARLQAAVSRQIIREINKITV